MPNLRVRIQDLDGRGRKTGKTTVSGIHYRALRDICTFAALHAHDCIKKAERKRKTPENLEALAYYQATLNNIKRLEAAILVGIAATFPPKPERPPTKEERRAAVRHSEAERKLMDDILSMMKKGA